jgi:hypothetical protein
MKISVIPPTWRLRARDCKIRFASQPHLSKRHCLFSNSIKRFRVGYRVLGFEIRKSIDCSYQVILVIKEYRHRTFLVAILTASLAAKSGECEAGCGERRLWTSVRGAGLLDVDNNRRFMSSGEFLRVCRLSIIFGIFLFLLKKRPKLKITT